MRYCRNFAKAGLKLSQYMVATQESINSRFCSVVQIKLSFFLKGGHLPKSGSIGLFKMFSRWIWGIFNIQIQSHRGHKLMLFMVQNKDKDLLGIYQYGCDPFCISLLTDRHLKVRSNSILFTFSDKGALTSARDS